MDKLKYIKLEQQDGSYSESIPLAVDSDHVDVNGNTLTEELNSKASKDTLNKIENQVMELANGSPLAVSSISEMTDTKKIYVNTSDGYWYFYTGNSWERGSIYQSTGIGEKSISINNLNNKLLNTLTLTAEKIIPNVTNGLQIQSGKTYNQNENYSTTDVIALLPGKTITFKTSVVYQQTAIMAQTSQDGINIINILIPGENSSDVKEYEYTNKLKDTIYIRICYRTNKLLSDLYVYTQINIDNEHLSNKSISIDKIDDALSDILGIEYLPLNPNVTNGLGIQSGGNFSQNENYSTTDVIMLPQGKTLYFTATVLYPQMALLAETNETGDIINSILITGEDSSIPKTYNYINNTNTIKYVRICYRTNKYLTNVYLLNTAISSETIENTTRNILNNSSTNPLYSLIKNSGYTSIFDRIACIGDSLTEGTFESTEGDGDNVPNLSTPSQLQKIIGNTVFNMGIAGMQASEANNIGWLSRAIAKGWFGDDFKSQCYIIALGVNDTWSQQGFDGNVSTDIDINDPSNNANNSVGGYASIIQKILSIQPRAKIFCTTIPLVSGNSNKRTEANKKIRAIAKLFNCYILDMEEYFIDATHISEWNSKYKLGSHYNPMGYRYVAENIVTYIDWIIRNNFSDFKEVCFIGTTKHYND